MKEEFYPIMNQKGQVIDIQVGAFMMIYVQMLIK